MSLGLLTSSLRTMKNLTDEQYDKMSSYVSSRIRDDDQDYEHILRRKTRLELIMISAAVCGVEFCYAAETAFVSPTLLKIGVPVLYMTWIWCLSPLIGFLLVPLLGSLSDRCKLQLGRRRPFILLLSGGIVFGLILIPNGQKIGIVFGDRYDLGVNTLMGEESTTINSRESITYSNSQQTGPPMPTNYNTFNVFSQNIKHNITREELVSTIQEATTVVTAVTTDIGQLMSSLPMHPFSIIFTVLGVMILDFSCDACQSPCRAYMVDVTVPADHGRGLVTFTTMAGLGGSLGYTLGGIDWGSTSVGASLGGHIQVVFTTVLVIYLGCMTLTMFSMREIPLDRLGVSEEFMKKSKKPRENRKRYRRFHNESDEEIDVYEKEKGYGSGWETRKTAEGNHIESQYSENHVDKSHDNAEITVSMPPEVPSHTEDPPPSDISLKTYLLSIIHMPRSLLILCVTNLFCWMSLVCYSLYFTDFVGQAVYGGNPSAPRHTSIHDEYDAGVRMGSFGMAFYSISCSIYSLAIENLVQRFGR